MRAGAIPAITFAQMREVDRLMIDTLGVTLEQMMENAGRALAELARRGLRGVRGERIAVLAGPGGNGGGALVAARRLSVWGASVSVVLATSRSGLHEVPAHQLAILSRMEVEVLGPSAVPPELARSAMILDGVLGYGLAGAPRGYAAALIDAANASGRPIIALDVPSGLPGSAGPPYGPTIRAHQTLTLALPKVELLDPAARPYVGELFLADISVPALVYRAIGLDVGPIFADADIVPLTFDAS
ncbi:MAG: NAD(P)H-hydrate epimerase [Chloroflexota bacterium]